MACQKTNKSCSCDFNIKSFGLCDPKRIVINGADRSVLNWSEISVPEILCIPEAKPNIENIDQIYATAELTSIKLIETPFAYQQIDRLATQSELNALEVIFNAINPDTESRATLLDTVSTAISALIDGIPAIDLTPTIETAINTLNSALDVVDAALDSLVTSSAKSLDLIALGPNGALASAVCELLRTLSSLIDTLLATIPALSTAAINLVNIVINLVPALETVLTPFLNDLKDAITALSDTVNAVLDLVLNLIDDLGAVRYLVIRTNEEGTCLTGRKLIIEGFLNQKVVYTGEVETQSVHSAHYSVPFSAFIVVYAKFEDLDYVSNVDINALVDGVATPLTISGIAISCTEEMPELTPDLCEEFCVEAYIEDVFATALDARTIFKNVTLFFLAKPSSC